MNTPHIETEGASSDLQEKLASMLSQVGMEASGTTFDRVISALEAVKTKAGEKAKAKALKAFDSRLTVRQVRDALSEILGVKETRGRKGNDGKDKEES